MWEERAGTQSYRIGANVIDVQICVRNVCDLLDVMNSVKLKNIQHVL